MHVRDGVSYAPVWQTWRVVRPSHRSGGDVAHGEDTSSSAVSGVPTLRERMQIARIERRMTVDDLAQALRCDAETLAGFERGDEVLPEALQRSIRRHLNLP